MFFCSVRRALETSAELLKVLHEQPCACDVNYATTASFATNIEANSQRCLENPRPRTSRGKKGTRTSRVGDLNALERGTKTHPTAGGFSVRGMSLLGPRCRRRSPRGSRSLWREARPRRASYRQTASTAAVAAVAVRRNAISRRLEKRPRRRRRRLCCQ